MKQRKTIFLLVSLLLVCTLSFGCGNHSPQIDKNITYETQSPAGNSSLQTQEDAVFYPDSIPAYEGAPFTIINWNTPFFTEDETAETSYEWYEELDALGRCGVTEACIGKDIMPTEERESISSVKPSGWINREYHGEYLYNRCHLIGFQLTGENANEYNLITGTRYMNVDGMLPFENMVADYVKETGNHVMYRVTPVFTGDNLVADGVLMEAKSVEDNGEGVLFCVFCYNVQPGITIDYATGESWESGTASMNTEEENTVEEQYILNTNSKKFHKPDCSGAKEMNEKNREEFTGTKAELIEKGYESCGICKP